MAYFAYWLLKYFTEATPEDKETVNVFISVGEMYSRYQQYCEEQNEVPLAASIFGKHMAVLFPNVKVRKRTFEDSAKQYYYGILRISDQCDDLPVQDAFTMICNKYNIAVIQNDPSHGNWTLLFPKIQGEKTSYLKVLLSKWTDFQVIFEDCSIDLEALHFPSVIIMDYCSVIAIGQFLQVLKICTGEPFDSQSHEVVRNLIIQDVCGEKMARTIKCKKVVNLSATSTCCSKCRTAGNYAKKKHAENLSLRSNKSAEVTVAISTPQRFHSFRNTDKLFEAQRAVHEGKSQANSVGPVDSMGDPQPSTLAEKPTRRNGRVTKRTAKAKGVRMSAAEKKKQKEDAIHNQCEVCHGACGDWSDDAKKVTWISCSDCEYWAHSHCVGIYASEKTLQSKFFVFKCPKHRRE